MNGMPYRALSAIGVSAALLSSATMTHAAPTVSRLTPPSALFSFNDGNPPVIARFFRGQRFDLAATVNPDAGQTITNAQFRVDGNLVAVPVTLSVANVPGAATNAVQAVLRAYANNNVAGIHTFNVVGYQSDGQQIMASTLR